MFGRRAGDSDVSDALTAAYAQAPAGVLEVVRRADGRRRRRRPGVGLGSRARRRLDRPSRRAAQRPRAVVGRDAARRRAGGRLENLIGAGIRRSRAPGHTSDNVHYVNSREREREWFLPCLWVCQVRRLSARRDQSGFGERQACPQSRTQAGVDVLVTG